MRVKNVHGSLSEVIHDIIRDTVIEQSLEEVVCSLQLTRAEAKGSILVKE